MDQLLLGLMEMIILEAHADFAHPAPITSSRKKWDVSLLPGVYVCYRQVCFGVFQYAQMAVKTQSSYALNANKLKTLFQLIAVERFCINQFLPTPI